MWAARAALVLVICGSLLHVLPGGVQAQASGAHYLVGAGIGDITGPSTEVNFMGYAQFAQNGQGIHTRLYARAFAMANHDGSAPMVYVSTDAGMTSQVVVERVVARLAATLGPDVYTRHNVFVSGTHSHSTPAGFLQVCVCV
jgi:neutral ceramidase